MARAIASYGVTKRYGEHTAVDHLSLKVDRGEIYGFLGLSGKRLIFSLSPLCEHIRRCSVTFLR
jgi:ABC-2 type transport system ATP-binding protein